MTSRLHSDEQNDSPREPDEATPDSAEGTKHDDAKTPAQLLPAAALLATARALGTGAAKYGAYNYRKGLAWSRLYGAAQRHLLAFWAGEEIDPDSGEHHLAHAAGSVLALLDVLMSEPLSDADDRPVVERYELTVEGLEVVDPHGVPDFVADLRRRGLIRVDGVEPSA